MNDRLYTVIFWGAISLTLHALIIALSPKQVIVSDPGSIEVSIIHTPSSTPSKETSVNTAVAPLPQQAVTRQTSEPQPTPPEQSTLPQSSSEAAADSRPSPSAAPATPPTDAVSSQQQADLPPIVTSTTGRESAPYSPNRKQSQTVAPVSPQAPTTTESTRPAEPVRPDGQATSPKAVDALDTAAIIERLVVEDEREVAESLAEIPTTNSAYWNYLMQRLAQPRWHHQQFNFRSLKRQRTLAVDLEFYPNGIVRAARIARSSGLADLDAAAIRASYAAAPFTPPPPEDRQYGYTYRIRLQYMPGMP